MKEISSFVTDAVVAGDKSLGHCLYISGVPGVGATIFIDNQRHMNARRLHADEKVDGRHRRRHIQDLPPDLHGGDRFVEINGLRLTSPEHLYTVCTQ